MFRSSLVAVLVASACAVGATAADASALDARGLVAHRAVYDLQLKDASERSGIEGMYGRMVYEFVGSACKGFTTNFRFVTQVDTGEAKRTTDQQTTTFEDVAANKFNFETKSFTDEQLDKEVRGSAADADEKLKVELSEPDKRELDLAVSHFPTEHMLDVIEKAKQGVTFFESRIFDGSEDGDKSLLTTTIIGKKTEPAKDDPDAAKAGAFAGTAYWPVEIAYFADGGSGDAMPVYRIAFKLYENGITRDLTMDYGEFSLTGRLIQLDMLDGGECR
jgi:hypothetical protein